jgi:hypothetical protein
MRVWHDQERLTAVSFPMERWRQTVSFLSTSVDHSPKMPCRAFTFSHANARLALSIILPVAQALPSHHGTLKRRHERRSSVSPSGYGDSGGDTNSVALQLPGLIAALLLFMLFTALVVLTYFFGPSLLRRWERYLRVRAIEKRKREKAAGPEFGFGFEGLSTKQIKGMQKNEQRKNKKRSKWWFVRAPEKPPALSLKPNLPLTPIELQVPAPAVTRGYSEETIDSGIGSLDEDVKKGEKPAF